jgi:hypothetical protein
LNGCCGWDLSSYGNVWNYNNWTLITTVLNRNRNYLKIFVDGTLKSGIRTTQPSYNRTAPLQIGDWQWWRTPPNGVIIDEVRIYNRALSDSEIKALYDATK